MTRETKNIWYVWLSIFFLLGIAHVLGAQADGTVVVQLGAYRQNLVAETTCSEDNKVVIIFHQQLDTLEYRLTMVHEQVHVRQMRDNCKVVQTKYRTDPKVRIEMEREAYCEDSKARLAAGISMETVKQRFYALMNMLYDVEDPKCPYIPP